MLGMHGTYEANKTMHHADVIFAVGVRFDDRTTNNLAKYCPDATVLHIDIDPTSISKTVDADIPIVGDARQVLVQMLELLVQDEKRRITTRCATGGSPSSSGVPATVWVTTSTAAPSNRRR